MAVRIRLRRVGKRNAPAHRIVVADSRSPRDGRFIETIGYYDPRRKIERIDLDRAMYWIGVGAQPSKTVSAIIKRAKAGVSIGAKARAVPAGEAGADEEIIEQEDILEEETVAEEEEEDAPIANDDESDTDEES